MWSRILCFVFNSLKIIGFRFIPSFWAIYTWIMFFFSSRFFKAFELCPKIEHQTYRRYLAAIRWFFSNGYFDWSMNLCLNHVFLIFKLHKSHRYLTMRGVEASTFFSGYTKILEWKSRRSFEFFLSSVKKMYFHFHWFAVR